MSFLRRREVRVEHWVQDVSNLSCWDVLRKRRGLDVSIVSCWELLRKRRGHDVSIVSCWDVLRERRQTGVCLMHSLSDGEDKCGRQFISGWVLKCLH